MATTGKIFVSYASQTVARARLVADTLRGAGYDVWIDDQLLAHRPFADSIEEALTAADAVLVLWSEQGIRSDWVRSEANRAREAGKLVQLRIDGCRLPMPFDQIHCIDLGDWAGESHLACWQSTLTSLSATIAARRPLAPVAGRGPRPRVAKSRGGLERRRITALACTIANWRDLADQDPEDQMLVTDAFHAAFDAAVGDHDGLVIERTGNSALALFGSVHAREEDGANAVRAALTLGVARDVDISCGVATGLVVVKGDGEGAAAVIGDTPGAARALAAAASAGKVLVAEGTRRVSEGMFVFADAPPATRDGGLGPLAAFEVVEALAVASRSQARSARHQHELFGREAELRLLRECWDAADEGMGQVALLTGEAGIGKSALLAAFRSQLAPATVQLTLHCGPAYTASALHPVEMALRQAAAIEPADQPAVRRVKLERYALAAGLGEGGAVEQLVTLVGGSPAPLAVEPTPERRRRLLLEQLLHWFEVLAVDGPALFVVEDLHWVDPTTLELLDLALAAVPDRRWMILGTARPEFSSDWADHSDLQQIELSPIGDEEACRICRQFDTEARLTAADCRSIIKRSDGNPLFVEEMTRFALAETASAQRGTGPIAIPDTLQDLLVARMDRLGDARELVRTAAALGRQFGYDLIAAATEGAIASAALRAGLRELGREGLIDIVGAPPRSNYTFRHALFVDAAYESIPKREREALHARIAAALRAGADGATVTDPAILAHHLTRAGRAKEAIPFWALAGAAAAAGGAHREALTAFRTALDLLRRERRDEAGTLVELQLLLGLAVSLSATLTYSADEVGSALGEARAICDALGNVDQLFVVLRGLVAFTITRGELADAEALCRRLLDIAERTDLPVHRIEALCAYGYVRWARGDLDEGLTELERMAALYDAHDGGALPRLSTMDPLINGLGPIGLAYSAQGDTDKVRAIAKRLDTLIETAPDAFSRAFAAYWRSTLIDPASDDGGARRAAEIGTMTAAEGGYTAVSALIAVAQGSLLGQTGDVVGGLALAAPGLAALRGLGQRHGTPFAMGEVAWLIGAGGDVHAALALIEEGIALTTASDELYWMAPLRLRHAMLLARAGRTEQAAAECAVARAVAAGQGARGHLALIDAVTGAMQREPTAAS